MVNRKRGRDWIYLQSGMIVAKGPAPGGEEIGVVDIVTGGQVDTMTTAMLLRCVIQMSWTVSTTWQAGNIRWYVAVLNRADPTQGVYSAADAEYDLLFPTTTILEARDPLRVENLILGDGPTFYGEPSDNVWALRADLRVKRSLNTGDRLSMIMCPTDVDGTSQTVTMNLDCMTLVRAA